jgi:hypothetical protein
MVSRELKRVFGAEKRNENRLNFNYFQHFQTKFKCKRVFNFQTMKSLEITMQKLRFEFFLKTRTRNGIQTLSFLTGSENSSPKFAESLCKTFSHT